MEEYIHSTNLRLVDIEAQGVSHFPEWKDHSQAAVRQVKTAEISVETLQQELIELAKSSSKHNYELVMIFNSFSTFQSSLQKSINTVNKRVDLMEDSNLDGTAMSTGLPKQLTLDMEVE